MLCVGGSEARNYQKTAGAIIELVINVLARLVKGFD